MKQFLLVITLLVVVFSNNLFSQINASAGEYHAIVIGIDVYEGTWTKLKSSVNDALSLKKILLEKYHFKNVLTLLNEEASQENMEQVITGIATNYTEKDRLLIFFSGHGHEKENKGYWVPANAKGSSLPTLVSNNLLQKAMRQSKCQSILLLTNAYFSDKIFKPFNLFFQNDGSKNYYGMIQQFMSRQIIRSGGVQPILHDNAKHSIFGNNLLASLSENTQTKLDAQEIFERLKHPRKVTSPNTPELGVLKYSGHEGGQFVFRTKEITNVCNFKIEINQGRLVKIKDKGLLTIKGTSDIKSYEWRKDGLIVSKTKTLTVVESGIYKVSAVAINECSHTDTIIVEIIKTANNNKIKP